MKRPLDQELAIGVLSEACSNMLLDAYVYGTAAPMSWLLDILIRIRHSLIKNREFVLCLRGQSIVLKTEKDLLEFISDNFSELLPLFLARRYD